MAALDFPASPTTGQIFIGGNGIIYQYNGSLWLATVVPAVGFRLLQRTVVSSAVPYVDITNIASDINDLRFSFDLTPVTNAVDLFLQFYDNGGAVVSTFYAGTVTVSSHAGAAGSTSVYMGYASGNGLFNYSATSNRVSNTGGSRGNGTIPNIRANRVKGFDFQGNYLNDIGTAWNIVTGSGVWSAGGNITGFRLLFNSGNIASGAFSVWGSP